MGLKDASEGMVRGSLFLSRAGRVTSVFLEEEYKEKYEEREEDMTNVATKAKIGH